MGKYRFEDLSQDTLRKLVESLEQCDVPIFLFDKDKMIFTNSAWEKQAPRISSKLDQGANIRDVMHEEISHIYPDLKDEALDGASEDFLKTVFETGGTYEFDGPDGRFYRAIYIPENQSKVLGLSLDITELKQSRSVARQARNSLESTLEGLHHGVMLYDETGHVSYLNESFRATAASLGITIEKGAFHKTLRDQLPAEIQDRLAAHGRQDLQDFEFIQQAPTGKYYLFEGRQLKNDNMLVSTVDVTELHEKRAEAKHTRKTLERSLEGLPHGVLLYNQHGKVEYFNSEFEATIRPMGMSVNIGMSYMELSGQLPHSFRAELRGQKAGEAFEFIQKRADGKSFLLEGHPIDDIGFLLTAVDVTAINEAMEAAKAGDVAKSSFLANMSHEIRTPMNGVLGMAQVLEKSAIDEHQQKCIDIIKSSSEMLLRIINDILDFSKLEAEKIEIEEEPINIEDVVNRSIDIVRPNLRDKPNVEIINHTPESSEHLHIGDADRIRQILINLLSNGIKFTPEGHVKISTFFGATQNGAQEITFRVEDTGIGISEDKYNKIFERFEQSDNSTTRKYGGTGLGLAISRRLARLMSGDLKICKNYKGGACFEFALSLQKGAACHPEKKATKKVFHQVPVLIIDDNKINHMVLKNQLEPLKVKPYCVTSAGQGLNILKQTAAKGFKIPLVICDYQMPGQTGYDFVQQMKSDPSISETPVMILSSADILSRQKDFKALGVQVVMEKPCSNTEITKAVSDLLLQSSQPQVPTSKPQQSRIMLVKQTNGPKILVADDDPVNREVFKGMLDLKGYQAKIVNNGLEALKAYCEEPCDLVLMDISMPVLGGIEATEKIRKFERLNQLRQCPIIAVTAHALKGDREKFLASGMNDYMPKPVLRDEFERMVDKWLENASENDRVTAIAS